MPHPKPSILVAIAAVDLAIAGLYAAVPGRDAPAAWLSNRLERCLDRLGDSYDIDVAVPERVAQMLAAHPVRGVRVTRVIDVAGR